MAIAMLAFALDVGNQLDADVYLALRTVTDRAFDDPVTTALPLTPLVGWLSPLAVVIALVAAALLAGSTRDALLLPVVAAVAVLLPSVIKVVLAGAEVAARPQVGAAMLDTWPSGHSAAAMSLALGLVVLAPRLAVVLAGGAFAALAGVALVAIGWHYPEDVLGGFLVAGAVMGAAVAAGVLEVPAAARAPGGRVRWPRVAALGGGACALGVVAAAVVDEAQLATGVATALIAALGLALPLLLAGPRRALAG